MALKEFLQKYDTILFDMDGVISTEENYWDSAALTVWEEIFWESGIDAVKMQENRREIRKIVFLSDRIIAKIKSLGINTNWDLAYFVYIYCKVLLKKGEERNEALFEKAGELIFKITENAPMVYDSLANFAAKELGGDKNSYERLGKEWKYLQDIFQEWYRGEEIYLKTYDKPINKLIGKIGLIHSEEPIISKEKLVLLLEELKSSGKILGIGTGRPRIEAEKPLLSWDIIKYFSEERIITTDDIVAAQKNARNNGISADLAKPHPYIFIKGALKKSYSDLAILNGDYEKSSFKNVLVVGDAGSDIIAAQRAGMDFAAVLTGIEKEKSRKYFENAGANYILNSVLDFSF